MESEKGWSGGVLILMILLSAIIPPLGIIFGIIGIASNDRQKHGEGITMMFIGLTVAALWVLL